MRYGVGRHVPVQQGADAGHHGMGFSRPVSALDEHGAVPGLHGHLLQRIQGDGWYS